MNSSRALKSSDFNELEGQIGNAAVNQEQTAMIAKKLLKKNELIVKLSNSKELKSYSDALKKPEKTYEVI